jgi:hypothetical protein
MEYYYIYLYSGWESKLTYFAYSELKPRLDSSLGECYNFSKLEPVPRKPLCDAMKGKELDNNLHNWVHHLETIPDGVETLYGYTIRFSPAEGDDLMGILQDVLAEDDRDGEKGESDNIHVQVRVRQATHENEGPPFSYNPSDDYVTEPGR